MTVGKDVSALFPDVVNCMQTDNLELKKLVYLYLMNYAKSQPDMAIMAVNTFVKVRCLKIQKFSSHLCPCTQICKYNIIYIFSMLMSILYLQTFILNTF
jgi:hypothetical protein